MRQYRAYGVLYRPIKWSRFVALFEYKSSAVAEMATVATIDMGLRGGSAVPLSRSAGNPSNTMWSERRSILPYQVASSSIQPFGHNSVGCHTLRRNISMNYYFVVEMHTVTVRSDDARYLLN